MRRLGTGAVRPTSRARNGAEGPWRGSCPCLSSLPAVRTRVAVTRGGGGGLVSPAVFKTVQPG